MQATDKRWSGSIGNGSRRTVVGFRRTCPGCRCDLGNRSIEPLYQCNVFGAHVLSPGVSKFQIAVTAHVSLDGRSNEDSFCGRRGEHLHSCGISVPQCNVIWMGGRCTLETGVDC